MNTITIFDTEITICDSVPDDETGNAINYAIEFLRLDSRNIASVSVYMQGGNFNVTYIVNTLKGVEEHSRMGDEEFVLIRSNSSPLNDCADEDDEELPDSSYRNDDMSEQIAEAINNVARQTERLADEIAWNTFWGK